MTFEPIRESEVMAHADEFETSLYLHLAPDRVKMDLAVAENDRMGKHVSSDSTKSSAGMRITMIHAPCANFATAKMQVTMPVIVAPNALSASLAI